MTTTDAPLLTSLVDEIAARQKATRRALEEAGLGGLLVFGNARVNGALRYLSGYFPDRVGSYALGAKSVHVFDGALLWVPLDGPTVLVCERGQVLDREAYVDEVVVGGLGGTSRPQIGLEHVLADLVSASAGSKEIGIELFDRFPTPLYYGVSTILDAYHLKEAKVVEQLMLHKSPWEISVFRKAGEIGDLGHRAVQSLLESGEAVTELDVIRAAEATMRALDPVYEEVCPSSPSLIASGPTGDPALYGLHAPLASKKIGRGDMVNWDICMRYLGYPIDTSRTRSIGTATAEHVRAQEVAIEMSEAIIAMVAPGISTQEMVGAAERVARDNEFQLWDRFIGHGLGLDLHCRPDMGREEMILEPGMALTVEPRIAVGDGYLAGNEDMVLVTSAGCDVLTSFPKKPILIA